MSFVGEVKWSSLCLRIQKRTLLLKKASEVSGPWKFQVNDSKINIVNFVLSTSQTFLKGYEKICFPVNFLSINFLGIPVTFFCQWTFFKLGKLS